MYRERPRQARRRMQAEPKIAALVNSLRLITCPTEAHTEGLLWGLLWIPARGSALPKVKQPLEGNNVLLNLMVKP